MKYEKEPTKGLLDAIQKGYLPLSEWDEILKGEIFGTWDDELSPAFDKFVQLAKTTPLITPEKAYLFRRLSGPVFEYLSFLWLEKTNAVQRNTVIRLADKFTKIAKFLSRKKYLTVKAERVASRSFQGLSLTSDSGYVVVPDGVIISGDEYSQRNVRVLDFYDATLKKHTKGTTGTKNFINIISRLNPIDLEAFFDILVPSFIVKPDIKNGPKLMQVVSEEFEPLEEKRAYHKGWDAVFRIPIRGDEILKLSANLLNEFSSYTISFDGKLGTTLMDPQQSFSR